MQKSHFLHFFHIFSLFFLFFSILFSPAFDAFSPLLGENALAGGPLFSHFTRNLTFYITELLHHRYFSFKFSPKLGGITNLPHTKIKRNIIVGVFSPGVEKLPPRAGGRGGHGPGNQNPSFLILFSPPARPFATTRRWTGPSLHT